MNTNQLSLAFAAAAPAVEPAGAVVINWGMGADSSWILALVLTRDWARRSLGIADDFSNLVVLTAQVGAEYPDTKRLGETHILPLLRRHRVRFVQVARSSRSTRRTKTDPGYVVLSDTRRPRTLHIEGGPWTLTQELEQNGTVAQYRKNSRTCSQKFKGIPCDRFLEDTFGDRPFVQVMGFNADETGRAERDDSYTASSKLSRTGSYPLIEWGIGRAELEAGLARTFERWEKSCCWFCPFQGTVAGRSGVLERVARFPELAARAMMIEHVSLALNPLQPLFACKGGCAGYYEQGGEQTAGAFVQLRRKLERSRWAIYRVRRVVFATRSGGKSGSRELATVATGSREQMGAKLEQLAAELGAVVDVDGRGTARAWAERRGEQLPAREELFVVAPAAACDKTGPKFAEWWAKAEPEVAAAA